MVRVKGYIGVCVALAMGVFSLVSTPSLAQAQEASPYKSETPWQAYVRNLPKGYSGQRIVTLKPPSPTVPQVEEVPLPPEQTMLSPAEMQEDIPAPLETITLTEPQALPQLAVAPAAPAPVALQTREVSYGKNISIYPLDAADAPMPYIPPAVSAPYKPVATKVKALRKQNPAEYNQ